MPGNVRDTDILKRHSLDSGTIRPVDKVATDVTPLGEVYRPLGKVAATRTASLDKLRLRNCGRPKPVFCPQHKIPEMWVTRIATVLLALFPLEEIWLPFLPASG